MTNRMSDCCSVCQDVFKTPKLLTCGHTFCKKCIDDIVESEDNTEIKCPLCRKVTNLPKNGAADLMNNFYAADRKYSKSILRCKACKIISLNKRCKFCGEQICENCMLIHMELKCGKLTTTFFTDNEETPIHDEPPQEYMQSLEGRLMSETFQSIFCFNIDKKIVIPNLFRSEREYLMNIHLSCISCFDGTNCIVVPNGDGIAFIYGENGKELTREVINIQVYSIAERVSGNPLMIESGTSMIYEYSNGAIRKLFWSQPLLPYDLSSLNDGRIVLVGTVQIQTIQGSNIEEYGAMRIYEYNGRPCKDIVRENGEFLFNFPRKICINIQNNDIYVGDVRKKQVMRFREDGRFVSLYRRREMENIDLGSGVTSELLIRNSHFPTALAYCQQNHLLFASYLSPIDRNIHILSPGLQLLGMFSSNDDLGVPVGLSCDDKGRLYVGDNADGIIRVFKLSQFVNRLKNI